jgi:hypothetical protein
MVWKGRANPLMNVDGRTACIRGDPALPELLRWDRNTPGRGAAERPELLPGVRATERRITMFTLYYGVHGARRVHEREYETLEEAKARGLRWSQSNSTGHYWAQVKDEDGKLVAQWN